MQLKMGLFMNNAWHLEINGDKENSSFDSPKIYT